jgi:hypothetical protein
MLKVSLTSLCCKNFRSPKHWLFDFIDRASLQYLGGKGMMEVISTHPHRVALKIYAYVDLLLLLNLFKTDPGHSREPSSFPTVRWSPPPHGSVVVKVGTAVFSNLHKVGTGVVIPDHNREFLVAATQWYCVTRVR